MIFVLVWLNGIKIYIASKDKYHQGICAGIVFMFFYQSILIIAGSSGICPLTGITLPFISSGGTSLVISFIMIGIVTSISGEILWKGVKEREEVIDNAVLDKEVMDKAVIDKDWEKINKTEGLLLSNAFQNPVIPGSVFKLITSTAIIEEKVDQEVVHDQGYLTIDGRRINNASKAAYGDLTFQQGFVHSSNVYFMDRMLKLGADSMKQAAKKYLVGEEISLDFTNLKSNFALEQENKVMLASTSFGQGETLMTTLHMAMVGQSIANDGIMLKPYLIQSIQDGKGKILTKGETEVLVQSTNKKTADTIKKAMTAAASEYGFQLIGDKKYQLAAKTGTAQKGNSENNAWMIALAPAHDPQYVVCINQLDTKNSGIHLKSAMEQLCSKLFSE